MEFLAREVIVPYTSSVLSPGVIAATMVMALVFVSGLGARAIECCEVIGQAWDSWRNPSGASNE